MSIADNFDKHIDSFEEAKRTIDSLKDAGGGFALLTFEPDPKNSQRGASHVAMHNITSEQLAHVLAEVLRQNRELEFFLSIIRMNQLKGNT